MLYVALAEAGALIAVVAAFAGLLRSLIRQHARERDLMLNKVLHSVGRPWETAPANEPEKPPEPPRLLRNVAQMAPEDRL